MVFIVTVQLRDCSVVTGGVVLLFDGTPLRLYVHLGKHRYRGYVIFFSSSTNMNTRRLSHAYTYAICMNKSINPYFRTN